MFSLKQYFLEDISLAAGLELLGQKKEELQKNLSVLWADEGEVGGLCDEDPGQTKMCLPSWKSKQPGAYSLIRVQLLVTPGTVTRQAPLSMRFSRQEYWSGLPFPSPGDLPYPGIKPVSPALQADSLLLESSGKPFYVTCQNLIPPIHLLLEKGNSIKVSLQT